MCTLTAKKSINSTSHVVSTLFFENGQMNFNCINLKLYTRNYNFLKCLLQSGVNSNFKDNDRLTVLNLVIATFLNPVVYVMEEQKISLVRLSFFIACHNIFSNVEPMANLAIAIVM